jgi:rfaE bifunctional protein kinase chain/domain
MTVSTPTALTPHYTLQIDVLRSLLSRFSSASVAVIGDFCLDAYWTVDRSASEISVETGLRTETIRKQRYSPGGAGNVVMNLISLGIGRVYPVGVLGNDPFGRELRLLLNDPRIESAGLISQDHEWSTPTYIKPTVDQQEQSRLDLGPFNRPSVETEASLLAALDTILGFVSVVLINEQVAGSVHGSLSFRTHLAALLSRHPRVTVIVDSRNYHDSYPIGIHKLNDRELLKASGGAVDAGALQTLLAAAPVLRQRWNAPLVVTRGERGCLVVNENDITEVCGLRLSGPTDPVGAGDTFSSALMACVSTGADLAAAAYVANLAAAVTVRKMFQTGTATPEEILAQAVDADITYHPDIAESLASARYVGTTEIELVDALPPQSAIRIAIFDHDGTISTLREGWEKIIEPMMIRSILGSQCDTCSDALSRRVKSRVQELIEATTGIQTIAQMYGLVELIREFGVAPADQILSPAQYKAIYNEELLSLVNQRLAKLDRGELQAADFTIKGATQFLRALRQAGVLLYLASGTDLEDVKREARHLGYADVFEDRIYGSVGSVDRDAKKVVLEQIMGDIGIAAGQLVVFGDGPVEMREARRRGALAIGIASDELRRFGANPAKRARLIRAGASAIVPDFTQWKEVWKLLELPAVTSQPAPHSYFDRSRLLIGKLSERVNKVNIERSAVLPSALPRPLSPDAMRDLTECAERIKTARQKGRPVMLAFGAHTIKNGLSPVLIRLLERGWVTLLATNGAGIIHDWEFAFQGSSSEDVRANVDVGKFGIWQDTGFNLNLALAIGAYEGLGYGASVGKMITQQGLNIPEPNELLSAASKYQDNDIAAAALDLLGITEKFNIPPGFLHIPHPFAAYSAQAAAFRMNLPFTAHPMFGHDIIYTHPLNNGAAIGRVALRDFLTYADQVHRLDGGVYLSVGSAVMSPMVFEKSLSMAQNIELQQGRKITNHHMVIVDIAENQWDWSSQGEPPVDSPSYYLRFCKTFSRMGGSMRYICADNRDFLLSLLRILEG